MAIRKIIHKSKNDAGEWDIIHAQTSAAQVVTDATKRFVSDTQIQSWTAMAQGTLASATANGLMSKEHFTAVQNIQTTVTAEIAKVVGGAPEQFDTLKEIADYLATNTTQIGSILTAIGERATKVEFDAHVADKNNPHGVTAAQIGLGNVNNTADTAKPISTAQQTEFNKKANLAGATFTGAVKAPTPAAGTNTTDVATTAFVKTAISAIPGLTISATEPTGAPNGSTWYEVIS